jgi:hypothetical protein
MYLVKNFTKCYWYELEPTQPGASRLVTRFAD